MEIEDAMYQLIFYVPATHLEKVKDALFSAGAGKYKIMINAAGR